jgi:hydroxyethylthiazole kinase-like uncharacterized protein yjeF
MLMDYIKTEQMRIIELNSAYLGVSLVTLMENAGRAAYEEIKRKFSIENKKITLFCGTGNNGGDGFVLARLLSNHSLINVILLGDPENIKRYEAKLNWDILQNLANQIKIHIIKNKDDLQKINEITKESDIIIDAILGTGIIGKLREPISSAIDMINKEKKIKISLDVPSGIDPDTGEIHDKAVQPELTITFHKPKTGLSKKDLILGEIIISPISIPLEAEKIAGPGDLNVIFKHRDIDSKKGDFVKLLVIGGSNKYHGAPIFSALAAIRTGIDLVIVASPEYIANTIRSFSPNFIVRDYPGKFLKPDSIKYINELIEWADSIVIGPGLGIEQETKEATLELFKIIGKSKKPLVVDADALKILAENKNILSGTQTVVTPHRGEFKILTGIEIKKSIEIQDKIDKIKNKISEYGITFVVKGAIDIIADKNNYKLNYTGNPGMTIGGTGDVLTGIIGTFLAQKANPFLAASAGTFINGLAGDLLNEEVGYHFTTSELIESIPLAIEQSINFPENTTIPFPKAKNL